MQGLVEVWAEWSIHVDCVLLFLASRVAETASEGAGGIEGTVKAAARRHAGEEKEERREKKRKKEKERVWEKIREGSWGERRGQRSCGKICSCAQYLSPFPFTPA